MIRHVKDSPLPPQVESYVGFDFVGQFNSIGNKN
jgi:hypothetical protein